MYDRGVTLVCTSCTYIYTYRCTGNNKAMLKFDSIFRFRYVSRARQLSIFFQIVDYVRAFNMSKTIIIHGGDRTTFSAAADNYITHTHSQHAHVEFRKLVFLYYNALCEYNIYLHEYVCLCMHFFRDRFLCTRGWRTREKRRPAISIVVSDRNRLVFLYHIMCVWFFFIFTRCALYIHNTHCVVVVAVVVIVCMQITRVWWTHSLSRLYAYSLLSGFSRKILLPASP